MNLYFKYNGDPRVKVKYLTIDIEAYLVTKENLLYQYYFPTKYIHYYYINFLNYNMIVKKNICI